MMTANHTAPLADDLIPVLPDNASVKIVGLGGVGGIVLDYLALFLKSLQIPLRLVLIDGDAFEPANQQRMRFSRAGNKAEVKASEIAGVLDGSDVALVAVPEFLKPENLDRLIREDDYLFLCVDNHDSRRLVSDHCAKLRNVVLFSGGNDGVELPAKRGTFGNVQIAIRRDGVDISAPITRFHPEIRNAQGKLPGQIDCGQRAVSSRQILMANLAVASALMNAFFAYTCGRLSYQEVQFDILEARSLPQMPLRGGGV
jgi:molybdopterin/thiamine biosynthesis adenylyltransferase